jgi:hypothetical protein
MVAVEVESCVLCEGHFGTKVVDYVIEVRAEAEETFEH